MKEKVLPVIVSTQEALDGCLKEQVRVIYIEKNMYQCTPEKIHEKMLRQGYTLVDRPARKGVFYAKDIDPAALDIHDPFDLL